MGLLERFAVVSAIVGGMMSASAQTACVNGVCTDTGRISTSEPLPADAYRVEGGRYVPARPGRFEPIRPGVTPGGLSRPTPGQFSPITPAVPYSSTNRDVTRGVYKDTPTQDYVVAPIPVVALPLPNGKGEIRCHPDVLDNNRTRSIQSLCADFSNTLGHGRSITRLPHPFTERLPLENGSWAYCRPNDPGYRTVAIHSLQVTPSAGTEIECLVIGLR